VIPERVVKLLEESGPADYWPVVSALRDGPKLDWFVVGRISFFLGMDNADERTWSIARLVIEAAKQDGVVRLKETREVEGATAEMLELVK
jgi:hypothetical protein